MVFFEFPEPEVVVLLDDDELDESIAFPELSYNVDVLVFQR